MGMINKSRLLLAANVACIIYINEVKVNPQLFMSFTLNLIISI